MKVKSIVFNMPAFSKIIEGQRGSQQLVDTETHL